MGFDGGKRRKREDTLKTKRLEGMEQLHTPEKETDPYGYQQMAGVFDQSKKQKRRSQDPHQPLDPAKEKETAYKEYLALRKEAKEKDESQMQTKPKKKKKKKKPIKHIIIIVLLILLILVVSAFLFVMNVLGKVGKVDIDQDKLGINPQVEENLKDYRNIAILGVDARDMTEFSNTRTDAIIIVSLDKKNKEIRQVSVFRDTYLFSNDDYGFTKVTDIHALAGTQGTLHTLNENMDLNIREVGIVNWKSVADVIDGLGGIKINVKESEIAEMNKYIRDTQKSIGGSKKKIKKPGKQTLNGNQAVTYARIRKDSPKGDYRRNERMKLVLSKTMEKAKKQNPFVLNAIAKQVLPEIKTNMNSGDMLKLLWVLFTFDSGKQSGWPYKVAGWNNNGVWYGPPITLKSNVKKLYKKYFDMPDYTPTKRVRQLSDEISNQTGYW